MSEYREFQIIDGNKNDAVTIVKARTIDEAKNKFAKKAGVEPWKVRGLNNYTIRRVRTADEIAAQEAYDAEQAANRAMLDPMSDEELAAAEKRAMAEYHDLLDKMNVAKQRWSVLGDEIDSRIRKSIQRRKREEEAEGWAPSRES